MRQRLRPRLPLGAILLSLVSAVWPLASEAQAPKRGGTLHVSYGNDVSSLDFHTATGYEMMWVAMNVGCGLINITPDGKFVGDAAESWHVSPDGLTYTFKLKKHVLGKEVVEYVADRMYWHTISGSPFYMVAQPRVKGYVFNAEFEVHWDTVWLDR